MTKNILTNADIKDIKLKVNMKLGELKRTNTLIKDEIFKILEKESKTLYYPVEDDKLCGFLYYYKKGIEYRFSFINTNMPLEIQVFTAAHELYHIWFSDMTNAVPLYSEMLNEDIKKYKTNREDLLANRFAAEFLMQEDIFRNEVENIRFDDSEKITIKDIVELMDTFLVPYKTIVKRLNELKFISDEEMNVFINNYELDREDILIWQERLQKCERNNWVPKNIKLDNLVFTATELYSKKRITYEKLEYLLGLAKVKPEYVGIVIENNQSISESELLDILGE